MRTYIALLSLLVNLHAAVVSAQPLSVSLPAGLRGSPILRFAEEELRRYLPAGSFSGAGMAMGVRMEVDGGLSDGSFRYRIRRVSRGISVVLSGSGQTEVLHAAHAFLEHLGYRFGVSGPLSPPCLRPDTLRDGAYLTEPYTRWRGIRQHVNFPMDISSYPQEEAREYLRNLVRMRFNKIAVHSYPNLWHEVRTGDSVEYAGNFFYNRRHDLPSEPLVRDHVRFNRNTFCIPELEAHYDDRVARSGGSVAWMRDLLAFAKSIGLRVHFSVEPRARGDVDYIVDNCRSALRDYPMVDELEINTEELGGWGAACSDTMVRDVLVRRFGKAALEDTFVTRVIRRRQTDLDNLLDQVGRNMEAVGRIREAPWYTAHPVGLKLGIYCVLPEYAGVAYHLVRRHLPGTEVTVMPGHGSVRTARHLSSVPMDAADLSMTTVFSWIEFDGLMFTQQNPVDGIASLFRRLDSLRGGRRLNAVLFNHWRTAESRVAARYAALSSLHGPLGQDSFYLSYASDLGLRDADPFRRAMRLLEETDLRSTNDLPNIGFCWIGAWLNGGPYMWMDSFVLRKVRASYKEAGALLAEVDTAVLAPEPRRHLAFLSNRVRASELYLQAFLDAAPLQRFKPPLSASDSAAALISCTEALGSFERYMRVHAEMMPDRGCEGTLVNLWHGPVYGLKVLRERMAGVPMGAPHKPQRSTDAPPLPILIKR